MEMTKEQFRLAKQMTNKWKFGIYKLMHLPLAWLVGIKIEALSGESCICTVKYKWLNKNPFRSLYFAVLAMTAELSTGALALLSIAGFDASIAVLVVESKGVFKKKATGKIKFQCQNGLEFHQILKECVAKNEPKTLRASTVGYDESGAIVAEYEFVWSFKVRNS